VITSPSGGTRVPTQDLVPVALRGLAASGLTPDGEMPFTLRGAPGPDGPEVRPEGHSLRYSAIVALGLARQPEDIQRDVLGGPDTAELARSCLALASTSRDSGAMALALWAAGEVAGATDSTLAARLLEAVHAGADLALGSRYVPGGGVTDWGLLRRLISEGGSTYARWVLGLRVRDLTGGFKCFRREVLEAIHFDGVRSQGYAFQVELTYRAVRAGFRVAEVPIVFKDRERGQSKMSWRIAAEAMWLVPLLRFGRQPASRPRERMPINS